MGCAPVLSALGVAHAAAEMDRQGKPAPLVNRLSHVCEVRVAEPKHDRCHTGGLAVTVPSLRASDLTS